MRKRSEVRAERRARDRDEPKVPEFQLDVPNDPINEQVLIAAELIDGETRKRLTKLFPPDAFYAEEHKVIHAACVEMERRGLEFDPATLSRIAPDLDIRYLENLMASRPEAPPNLEFHVDTLKWDWSRAQLVKGPVASFLESIQNPRETPDRVRALCRQIGEFAEREASSTARFLRDPAEVVREMMAKIDARVEGEAIYPFGIPALDDWEAGAVDDKGNDIGGTPRLVPGADPGGTTVVTGMSGSGKTTLTAHAILGIARGTQATQFRPRRRGRRVAVGAWEVRAPMTLELLTVISLAWNRARLLNGRSNQLRNEDGTWAKLTREERITFEERAHAISKKIVFIDNPFRRGSVRTEGRVTNDDYLDILEDHVEASGCEVVFYDLFDRVLRYRKPDDEQEALWRMLEMGERLQIHQFIVHQQLLKGEDVRKDMQPSLQGLKGSSAYVDAGSLIIAPHLPARWKNVPDTTIEIFGLKQRFGPPFGVECDWDPATGQITNGRTMNVDSRDSTDEYTAGATGRAGKFLGGGKKKARR